MKSEKEFNIAIVDDDSFMQEMITDYFQAHFPEAKITNFMSGEDALNTDLNKYQLILLDYYLGKSNKQNMDGLEILKKFNLKYSNIPVIVLSGQDDPEIAGNILQHGAWDYIIKNQDSFKRLGFEVIRLMDRKSMNSENNLRNRIVNASLLIAVILFAILLTDKFIN